MIEKLEEKLKSFGDVFGNKNYYVDLAKKLASLYKEQFKEGKIGHFDNYQDTIPLMRLNLDNPFISEDNKRLLFYEDNNLNCDELDLISSVYMYTYLVLMNTAKNTSEEALAGMFYNAYFDIINLAREKIDGEFINK